MSTVMRVRTSALSAKSVAVRSTHQVARPVRFARLVPRASPQEVEKKIQDALKAAEEVCADGTKQDCAVAWDTVEELSAAASHMKDQKKTEVLDPLEEYCKDNEDADECRVYED